MTKSSWVYVISIVAHAAIAGVVLRIKEPTKTETIAISVSEAHKEEKPPPPPEPAKVIEDPKPAAQTEAPKPQPRAKVAPAAPKDAPPPEAAPKAQGAQAMDALPDFGLSMGNGPGGMAVPQGGGPVAAAAPTHAAPQAPPPPKVLNQKPAEAAECSEPPVKPKPKGISQPGYTASARDANIEGRVRVEVSVDATGKVTSARILSGLGYGLDEAALESARRATFDPGTRCGKPVSATFVIAMRFSL